jgi:ubiquinone/menaquinone biosynthesis C-methylase UbiE
LRLAAKLALAAGGGVGVAALWWRTHPSACPYGQRFWVQAPHPIITRARLREILGLEPGERILEVGPGTGYYTLPVAGWLAPSGTLHILDLQQEMLDHVMRDARAQGVENIRPRQGDARELPYPDDSFDGAYLTTVLGEIPEPQRALTELHRVLNPTGRLVVGELFGDPHWISPNRLRHLAESSGLRFERRVGGPLGYFARFGPEDGNG